MPCMNVGQARSRFFLWTEYNKPTDEYLFDDRVQYAHWQLEKGESSENTHYQGFLHMKLPSRPLTVKSMYFSSSAHIEVVRKVSAAAKYCRKLKTRVRGPWTFGTPTSINIAVKNVAAGSATEYKYDPECEANKNAEADLTYIETLIADGLTLKDIMIKHNVLYKKYKAEIETLVKCTKDVHYSGKYEEPRKVFFFSGSPGTGKSTIVDCIATLSGRRAYLYEGDWWPSYDGQEILFIDECVKGTISFTFLNTIIDRRRNVVQVKGGHVCIKNITHIFIASNYSFENIFRKTDSSVVDALRRRVNLFVTFKLDEESNKVTVTLERYSPATRKLMLRGDIIYYLHHNTYEEGRACAEVVCKEKFIDAEELSDLFAPDNSSASVN